METAFLDWLVADVPLFGLRAQNWMVMIAVFVVFYGFACVLKRERRHG
jgi:hypothetical protein